MAVGFDINPIQPVAAQIKPPQGMSLADMVNMAGGIQQYQQAQKMNPLQLEQQRSLTGTAEEQRQQAILGTAEKQLGLNQKKFKTIADSQIAMINDPEIVAAEANPNAVNRDALVAKVRKAGLTLAANVGIPPQDAETLIQPYVELAATDPGKLRTYYKQRHIQGLDEGARTSALSPSGTPIATGAGGYVVSTNPFGEQQPGQVIPGMTFTKVLGPGERTIATSDIQGNPIFAEVAPTGGPTGRTAYLGEAMPVAPAAPVVGGQPARTAPAVPAMPGAPGVPAPTTQRRRIEIIPPNESIKTRDEMNVIRATAQDAADAAQNYGYFANQVLDLVGKTGATGTGADIYKSLTSLPVVSKFVDTGTTLAELEKNLNQSAVAAGNKLGLNGSDAARQMSTAITGSPNMPGAAIASVTRSNRALQSTAPRYFVDGMEAAIAKEGSVFAIRNYRRAWKNLDPKAILLADLQDNGDKEGLGILYRNLGFEGASVEERKGAKTKFEKLYNDYKKLLQLRQGNY